MKKVQTVPQLAPNVSGNELIRRMALQALNQSKRDRMAARRLFKQWLLENDDLLEAVAGPSISLAITQAIGRDIRIERQDVLKLSRALPTVTNGVDVSPAPRSSCIPIASADAESRRAAHVVRFSGLLGFAMPETGKLLGECRPWEAKEASLYYGRMRKGFEFPEQWLAFVWQACPDRDKKAADQRTIAQQLQLDTLRLLDTRARRAIAARTLGGGDEVTQ